MAKRPTITSLGAGVSYDSATLTANFEALRDQFDNTVSRDGSAPNAMAGDLDMNSYDILNVGEMDIATLTVNGLDVTSVLNDPLNGLTPGEGDLLYYTGGAWALLSPGTNGQVVKLAGGVPTWGEDVDTNTDTDTVGITVEEDGVSIQTNVTVLNFVTGLQATTPIVTVDGSNNVTVDLDTFVNG